MPHNTRARVFTLAVLCLVVFLVACGSDGESEEAPSPDVLVGGAVQAPESTPEDAVDEGEAAEAPEVTDTPAPTRAPVLVSLDWLAGDVGVPGLGGAVAPPTVDAGLQGAVNAGLAGFGGRASVVVHNLADGRYAAVNETDVHYAASTYKAAVLLEAYRQRDAGQLDFAKQVPLTEEYAATDLGTLEYLEIAPGDLVTIADAVKGMIVVSDTPLALLVTDEVTHNSVDATLREVGTTVMTVNSHDLPTTALDLAQVMTAITAGYGVSAASRDEMLSYLAQEWFREGVIAGVPGGTTVAHKSGSFSGAVHDAAVVWGPAGPYVITVLTDGSGGWPALAAVSSAVWDYFAANP
jgi:beta-lactamase class A